MFLKNALTFTILFLIANVGFAQNVKLKGTVKDASNGDLLIGAIVLYADGKGAVTDIDGNFGMDLPVGEYTIKVSYVGYEPIEKKVVLKGATVNINFELNITQMKEVVITSELAKDRETPVAFTNVNAQKLDEELAGRDVPMLLNDIAGVQASVQGGSDGDIKVTIRGFSQRNVAMMVDGVPLNDMESGAVYWSNWTGLDIVTRTVQVQRGLGASKLAIPAIGGSINFITKGIEAKRSLTVAQEVGMYGYARTSVAYTSGRLKGGWGITAASSFRRKDGYVDQTGTIGGFGFVKIEKSFKDRHMLTLWGSVTPQVHGQRDHDSYNPLPIAVFDTAYAKSLGVQTKDFETANGKSIPANGVNRGLRYNPNWGNLDRFTVNSNGDTTHSIAPYLLTKNNYQKPQINLKYSFDINPKVYWTTTAYLSIGRGGGTRLGKSVSTIQYDSTGQQIIQPFYNGNLSKFVVDTAGKHIASQYLLRANNDHIWYGILSNVNYKINKMLTLNSGIDARDYSGHHYGTIADLLGGDYYLEGRDFNSNAKRSLGDIVYSNYRVNVRWAGVYSQLELSMGRWNAFLGVTASYSGYQRVDYFVRKDLVLSDTTYKKVLGINDTKPIVHNGASYNYNSKEAQYSHTPWKWLPGYTFKAGASYKINEFHSVFLNAGYLNKAPISNNVLDGTNLRIVNDLKSEIIKSVEVGYELKYAKFGAHLNGYLTYWDNRPLTTLQTLTTDEGSQKFNVNNMNARHLGVELEGHYKVIKQIQIEGVFSYADWRWTSRDSATFNDSYGNLVLDPNTGKPIKVAFDARGVHVGDAPQTQMVLAIRVEPIKGLFLKVKASYFMRYYSQIDPISLNAGNEGRDSWMIPNYGLIDVFAGYKWQINKQHRLDFNVAVLNVLNKKYISDAWNNEAGAPTFDAKAANVFFGMPINFTAGIKYTFN